MTRLTMLVLSIALLGCQSPAGPSPTPPGSSPAATAFGLDELVVALRARAQGTTVKVGEPFVGDPIAGKGTTVCLGLEAIRVYTFASAAERAAVAQRIDPLDPTKIGTSIVDWAGRPRFWQGERILVLYTGTNDAVDAALTVILGQPFAKATGPGRPDLPGGC